MSAALWLDNLRVLRAAVEAQPSMGLANWAEPRSCGTIYCIGGLATTLPHFQKQGLRATMYGTPCMVGELEADGCAHRLFGHRGLFAARYWWENRELSDKQVALARIDARIEIYTP